MYRKGRYKTVLVCRYYVHIIPHRESQGIKNELVKAKDTK